jgi:ribosome maturation factor RimP
MQITEVKNMAGKQIEDLIEREVAQIIQQTPLELVDVEYTKDRDWYLRVFLDKPGGLEVEDCQWVSDQLGKRLDELDPIKESYIMEVSSPGLDRPLKKDRDFVRHIGDKVEIHTFTPVNGQKTIVGKLLGLENNAIQVDIGGAALTVPRDQTSQVRLYIDF